MAIGLKTQIDRIAFNYRKSQNGVEHQNNQTDKQVRDSPAVSQNKPIENWNQNKLAQTGAGKRQADGQASALFKPFTHQ